MRLRTYIPYAVGAITTGACMLFVATLVNALWYHPTEQEAAVQPAYLYNVAQKTGSAAPGIPARLIIPSIGVNASVQDVGIGKSGNMAVPLRYADVGWYRYGPKPGETGSAVIDGHIDNGFGLDAVFKHLSDLKQGDDLYVETTNGERVHFVVEEEAQYPVAEVPLQKIFNRADAARLTLITCAGSWIAEQKAYDSRTVVYAKLAS